MKITKKGFALLETLIVTIFVMTVFTLIFSSFYPLVGNYEKSENYDDVDSKYLAHYVRKHIVKNHKDAVYTLNQCNNTCKIIYSKSWNENTHFQNCNNYFVDTNPTSLSFCQNFPKLTNIDNIYLIDYNVTAFKNYVTNTSSFSRGFKEYVESLPASNKSGYYRIILEISKDSADGNYSYSTIEVKR